MGPAMTTDLSTTPLLPGQLGTPGMQLRDDPRADPRMVAALAPLGMDGAGQPAPVDANSPLDAQIEFCSAAEVGFTSLFDLMNTDLPPIIGVATRTETIKGVDGNDILLYIHQPENPSGPTPGILHLHGGGMSILTAADTNYVRWRNELAAAGLTVIGVEFRNASGQLGPHQFPAGLNDCSSALDWMHDNRQSLGLSSLVVSGESGGGNLTLATALKAKREGKLDQIDGIYAQCPYISNAYGNKLAALPSLFENDFYFLEVSMMGAMAATYTPGAENAENPLAWPYHATTADLEGLPPTVISVNELDPLRDEGLAFHRKLLAANVSSVSRTVNGTCHAGDLLFPQAMPDVYAASLRDLEGFAKALS